MGFIEQKTGEIMKTFENKKLYRLQASKADIYTEDGKRYEFALSTNYAGGATIADCWIQSEDGEVHPMYGSSPIPLHRDAVIEID
jgi:hypothetical protein